MRKTPSRQQVRSKTHIGRWLFFLCFNRLFTLFRLWAANDHTDTHNTCSLVRSYVAQYKQSSLRLFDYFNYFIECCLSLAHHRVCKQITFYDRMECASHCIQRHTHTRDRVLYLTIYGRDGIASIRIWPDLKWNCSVLLLVVEMCDTLASISYLP